MIMDSDDERNHFNYKDIVDSETKSGKSLRSQLRTLLPWTLLTPGSGPSSTGPSSTSIPRSRISRRQRTWRKLLQRR